LCISIWMSTWGSRRIRFSNFCSSASCLLIFQISNHTVPGTLWRGTLWRESLYSRLFPFWKLSCLCSTFLHQIYASDACWWQERQPQIVSDLKSQLKKCMGGMGW
jgi:hypothetical protein